MSWFRNIFGFDILEQQITLLKDTLAVERATFGEQTDYLRAQLAQKQRRIDELQEALIGVKTPPAPRVIRKKDSNPWGNVVPLGWDAFREHRRSFPAPEPEPEKGIYEFEPPKPPQPVPETAAIVKEEDDG